MPAALYERRPLRGRRGKPFGPNGVCRPGGWGSGGRSTATDRSRWPRGTVRW